MLRLRRAHCAVSLCALSFAFVAAAACSDNGTVTHGLPPGSEGGGLGGLGVGQACDDNDVCRPGLACVNGKCAPCQCDDDGTQCVISDECKAGSYCGPGRTCTPGGKGKDGDLCKSDADCGPGLRCDLVGFSAECKPEGHGDVGGACKTSADCYAGLGCMGGSCQPYPPSSTGVPPLGIPTWKGETCNDDPGATQAYFHVPRGSNDGDFYRLPFPNDVRNTSGKISLSGHPTPGAELLGFDVLDRWLRDLEATVDGFSTYPTIYFRFSNGVDFNSLKASGALKFVDVTDAANAQDVGYGWIATTDRNAYICKNWMGIRPPSGAPLAPGHVYAAILMTSVVDSGGKPIQVSADLTALLGASAPSDPVLAPHWPKYKPIRDWAAAKSVPVTSILNATVFTVGHPNAIGGKLSTAVAAAQAPAAASWVKCGAAPSPCPQATGKRACPSVPDPAFDELHALVTLPIFQKGTEPYSTPTDGGDFVLDGTGLPQPQRTEQVCMALTVPKGATMPAAGWPLVVYAHGTGGSFRSFVDEGVAKRMASIDDGAGGHYNVAVLGIDQVEHGPRRGSSTESPNNLFYNFTNPLAGRGNALQGAADQMALVRLASALDVAAGQSPTGAEIKIGKVAFWGHSQGATEGGIAMPYTANVVGAVLSGEGAGLIDGLLGKKNPVDVADVLPFVLEEDPKQMGVFHPVLALLQNDLDRDDPLNHASALVQTPVAPATQKHVLQPYGQGDTYAPPTTEATFAVAAQLAEAAPPSGVVPDTIWGNPPLSVPAGGNANVGGATITAIVRQYAPNGYDGHFVAFQNAGASADVDHFLGDALAGKVPKVGR